MVLVIVILGIAAVMTYYWSYVVDWLSRSLIPWVREKLGNTVGDMLTEFVTILDKTVVFTRQAFQTTCRFINTRLLKAQTTYEKKSPTEAVARTETIVINEQGKGIRRVEEKVVEWSELPAEVRKEMIRQGNQPAMLDMRELVMQKAKERAQEEGMVLEVAT